MDLGPHVEEFRRRVEMAAQAGGAEDQATAERLVAPLEAAFRLALLDVLAAAAEEITVELAPGSVELRLRARDPEFVVAPPPTGRSAEGRASEDEADEEWPAPPAAPPAEGEEGAPARINVRLPESLKARIEQAAGSQDLSVNAWLVRAAASALERAESVRRREYFTPPGAKSYRGWAR
jgi:HicB family